VSGIAEKLAGNQGTIVTGSSSERCSCRAFPDNMTSGRPSAVLNPEQCTAIWNNAVPTGDLLAKSAAAPFIVNFTQVDKDGSGDISKTEFEDACAKGLVKNIEN
jgi:hypothetical protein